MHLIAVVVEPFRSRLQFPPLPAHRSPSTSSVSDPLQDQDVVDMALPATVLQFSSVLASLFSTLGLIIFATPWFTLGLIPISAFSFLWSSARRAPNPPHGVASSRLVFFYAAIREIYRRSARELQRIEAIARSPIFAHLLESTEGGEIIRSAGNESRFARTSELCPAHTLFGRSRLHRADKEQHHRRAWLAGGRQPERLLAAAIEHAMVRLRNARPRCAGAGF